MDQFGGGGGADRCWFLSRPSCAVQAEPLPELEARVLYSLILFLSVYAAVTFKIQSWGGLSGSDGEAWGEAGGRAGDFRKVSPGMTVKQCEAC